MPSNVLSNKPKPKALEPAPSRFDFEAIGTAWQISFVNPFGEALATELEQTVRQRIETFDRHYSRFRNDSLVSRMAAHAGTYDLPDDAQPLLDLYRHLYELTDGTLTPLVGQLLADAGYDAQYSLQSGSLRPTLSWEAALAYDFPRLVVKQPVLLDFGAAGKGYLVDLVADLLTAAGLVEFVINAGGDILQRSGSAEPLLVGLEHPDQLDEVIGVARLHNQSLCGSAGNRRVWGDFHHLIDPFTQSSPRHVKATWVLADTTLLADGLSTALFFAPAARLRRSYDFEYASIHDDDSLEASPNFPAEYFTEQRPEQWS